MRRSDDTKVLAAALVTFQASAPKILKDDENPHFRNKFASLHAIVTECRPKLAECGLAVSQWPGITEDGTSTLVTVLMHTSGQFMESETPLLLSKADPQGQGSAITYMRRYAMCAILGIVADEDDDGEAASKASRTPAKRPAKPPAQTQMVNGEEIPLSPEMETTRSGPPSNIITGPQVNKIRIMQRDLGYADTDIQGIVSEVCPPWPDSIKNLTKQQASALIDALSL